jgi:hypothetical protein
MVLFAIAARLNSQGVAALLQGEDKSAVAALAQSLEIINQVLLQEENPRYTRTKLFFKEAFSFPERIEDCEFSTTEVSGFQAEQAAHLFTKAFSFPERIGPGRSCAPNESHVNFYAAAVVFNAALVHHRQGQKGDATSITRAQKLYDTALRLIDGNGCLNRTALIVKLAAINNLSRIHFDCGDYKLARQGMGHISSLMMRISGTCNQAVFQETDVQSLLLNVLLLKAPEFPPAA